MSWACAAELDVQEGDSILFVVSSPDLAPHDDIHMRSSILAALLLTSTFLGINAYLIALLPRFRFTCGSCTNPSLRSRGYCKRPHVSFQSDETRDSCVELYFVIVCKFDSSVLVLNRLSVYTRISSHFFHDPTSGAKNDVFLPHHVVMSGLDHLSTSSINSVNPRTKNPIRSGAGGVGKLPRMPSFLWICGEIVPARAQGGGSDRIFKRRK